MLELRKLELSGTLSLLKKVRVKVEGGEVDKVVVWSNLIELLKRDDLKSGASQRR